MVRVGGREGEDVHVAHGGGGDEVGDGVGLEGEVPGVGEGGGGYFDLVPLVKMHEGDVVEGG